MAGLLDLIKQKLGYVAPQQNVFTNRVNPQLQQRAYAQQEDPRQVFARSLVEMAGPKQAFEKTVTKARRIADPAKRQKLVELGHTIKRVADTYNDSPVGRFFAPRAETVQRLERDLGVSPDFASTLASFTENFGAVGGTIKKLPGQMKLPGVPAERIKVPIKTKPSTEKVVKVSQKVLGDIAPETVKDISSIDANFKPITRIIEKSFGQKAPDVKRRLIEPFDAAKGAMIEERNNLAARLKSDVVDRLGIKKGSQESRLVQLFGEKKIDLPALQQVAPKIWGRIVEADKWFRQEYDRLLDEVNEVRAQIYPNRPDKQISRRQDYYRHFQELSGFEGIKNLFEGPSNIPTELAGVSDFTNPKSKFLSFAQKRLGGKTSEDAVGGFLDYIRASTYAKHVDPHISKFQGVAKELEDLAKTSSSPQLGSRLAEFFRDYSGDLAGKTNVLDRSVQKVLGRRFFQVIDKVNTRVKLNTILGNLSSSVAQAGNIPQMIANFGAKNFAAGFTDVLRNTGRQDKLANSSVFLKERYAKDVADMFDRGVLANTKKFAGWVTQALDEISTKSGWYAAYRQAVEQGVANPTRYADNAVREMVAGRGIGEVPLVQKSRIFQVIAPFQLEVQNLWQVLGKNVSEKEFGKVVKFMVAAYGFNKATEAVRGSGVTFDPVEAVVDAYNTYQAEEDKTVGATKAGGRLAGEVLSNVIGGQTLAGLYPEYGVEIGGENITRKELFGDEDPTRFGSGLLAAKGLQDPLYKIVPPLGGSQIKKTYEGGSALARGYTETKKGEVKYPVEPTATNVVKGLAFGSGATKEGKEYYKENRRPLGEQQSEAFKVGGKSVYDSITTNRKSSKADEDAVKKIESGKRGKAVAADLGEGLFKLPSGKIGRLVDGEVKKYDTEEEAKTAAAREEFKKSGKKFLIKDGKVFKLTKGGDVTIESETDYQAGVDDVSFKYRKENLKEQKNWPEWRKLVEQRFETLLKRREELADGDPLDLIKLEEEITDLVQEYAKYRSYGGAFTKPKKKKLAKVKTVGGGTFTKPKFAKFSAPKIAAPKLDSPHTKLLAKLPKATKPKATKIQAVRGQKIKIKRG